MNLPELKMDDFSRVVRETMKAKGWPYEKWETFPTVIALVHSELSEALEAYRVHTVDPKFKERVAEEFADVIIRMMDFSGGVGMSLEKAIRKKFKVVAARGVKYKGRTV